MGRTWPKLILTAVVVGCPVAGQAQEPLSLDCQLNNGPWQRCQMVRSIDGYQWRVEMEQQAFQFRHDGRGVVSMRQGKHPWHPVAAHWREDASLCWNGLCAKGEIPLD